MDPVNDTGDAGGPIMLGDANNAMPATTTPIDPWDILAGYGNPANYVMPGDATSAPADGATITPPPTSTSTKLAIALGIGALFLAALVVFAPPRGRGLED